MKSMEQELLCPVCDEMVKQPIILPCQHSVCLLCAAEVLVQRGYPPPDLPPEPYSPSSTPNTRSPRQTRRPAPRTPDRLERVLRTGKGNGLCVCVCLAFKWTRMMLTWHDVTVLSECHRWFNRHISILPHIQSFMDSSNDLFKCV